MPSFSFLKEEAIDSCRGKAWWLRAPLLLFLLYILIRHVGNPEYRSIMAGLNLGVHELGHVVFSPFGKFMMILGGTLLECLFPLLGMINFYRQKNFFAIAFCIGWLSTAFFDVVPYVADARAQELPLLGLTDNPIHDWHYMLGKLHLLPYDATIAGLFKIAAILTMLVSLALGTWLVIQMYKTRSETSTSI